MEAFIVGGVGENWIGKHLELDSLNIISLLFSRCKNGGSALGARLFYRR